MKLLKIKVKDVKSLGGLTLSIMICLAIEEFPNIFIIICLMVFICIWVYGSLHLLKKLKNCRSRTEHKPVARLQKNELNDLKMFMKWSKLQMSVSPEPHNLEKWLTTRQKRILIIFKTRIYRFLYVM